MDDRWHEDLQEQVRQEACERGTAGRITVSQQQVLRLLEQGDDRLHQVLSTLHRQLRIWQCLDDHATSERDAVLTGDTKAERMLAAAVCDVMDALTEDNIDTSADHLAHMIQAEVDSETAAYRSPAKVRLMRLQSCIHGWLDDAPDQQAQLAGVARELLLLCDHLGILPAQHQALEVRPDVIRQRAVQLLRTEHNGLHDLLISLHRAMQVWEPFDDHATSEHDGVLRQHTKAEGMLADVLVQLITLVCQPDQQASPQAKREAMAYQLAKHLEPMGPLVATARPGAMGQYVADLEHALQLWMSGKPAGAQMLANAVVALPDVLEPQEVAQ